MAKWIKPNGKEIEIHENSIEYAQSLGWKRADEKPEKQAPKKSRSKKSN